MGSFSEWEEKYIKIPDEELIEKLRQAMAEEPLYGINWQARTKDGDDLSGKLRVVHAKKGEFTSGLFPGGSTSPVDEFFAEAGDKEMSKEEIAAHWKSMTVGELVAKLDAENDAHSIVLGELADRFYAEAIASMEAPNDLKGTECGLSYWIRKGNEVATEGFSVCTSEASKSTIEPLPEDMPQSQFGVGTGWFVMLPDEPVTLGELADKIIAEEKFEVAEEVRKYVAALEGSYWIRNDAREEQPAQIEADEPIIVERKDG